MGFILILALGLSNAFADSDKCELSINIKNLCEDNFYTQALKSGRSRAVGGRDLRYFKESTKAFLEQYKEHTHRAFDYKICKGFNPSNPDHPVTRAREKDCE